MKVLSIGDIHGHNIWKDFVKDPSMYDKIIFVGDYVDDYDISNTEIISNLLEIIEFKKEYPDKVILLLGNHDYQYAIRPFEMEILCYSTGYRAEIHFDLHTIFKSNFRLFQIAYQYENYIWTHAGIHIGWYQKFLREFKVYVDKYDLSVENYNIADKLNLALEFEMTCLVDCGFKRRGTKKIGGPLWADKSETWMKSLKNYHQIVGHTHTDGIKKTEHPLYKSSVTYIDALPKECLILEI